MFRSINVTSRIFERQIRTPAPGTSVIYLFCYFLLSLIAMPLPLPESMSGSGLHFGEDKNKKELEKD